MGISAIERVSECVVAQTILRNQFVAGCKIYTKCSNDIYALLSHIENEMTEESSTNCCAGDIEPTYEI